VSSKSLDDLVQIVRNGGSLDLQIGGLSTSDLLHLVCNAREKSTLILRGAKARTTEDLLQISRNAVGTVILDIN
jgi:hypothetical protein